MYLSVHVPDVNSPFVIEEYRIAMPMRVNTEVVLVMLFMCDERLDNEASQLAISSANLQRHCQRHK